MPNRLQVRITRQAISPRLAIKILSKSCSINHAVEIKEKISNILNNIIDTSITKLFTFKIGYNYRSQNNMVGQHHKR